ncbi:hypothetical protein A2Y99_03250 [Candidatus Gottesmanbacteria bacterium RBG_13_37_7]|uniref:DUF3147 family protein n=1 Tax=Candidatus Gottesmanbacteria bacterium RBG_13_37_7 TaxID=1798369 RepID=A0A1F5YJ53_9BACT|nr:MAG: hypothetical protein A2Y99_03250 [Candidatus Gottesmanbacteria bacterium RBG_13_37_7]
MDPFIVKVFLSLITGVVFVVVSTNIAERVSGKLGGLIVGLPSTAVISLLFIGLTQGVAKAMIASAIVPFSSGLYCFYFITFLLLTKKGFSIGFIGSLIIWFLFATISSIYSPNSIIASVIVWLLLETVCIWWTVNNIHINHSLIPKRIISSPLWLKAILTGSVIGLIVIIGKVAGPRWGGIFATFPALTISTFLITIKSGGVEFTRLIAKNILISTTTTISIFAILCYFLYPIIGVILGTVLAYLGLLVISAPFYFLVFEKIKE